MGLSGPAVASSARRVASMALLLPLVGGCREAVAEVAIEKVDEPASTSFSAKANEKYNLWSDFRIETSEDDAPDRYCYELQVEFRRKDEVQRRTCWPFTTSYCDTASSYGEHGECLTECSVRFARGGEVTVKAELVNTGTKCVRSGVLGHDVTCGISNMRCRQALQKPTQLERYELEVAED